MPSRVTDEAPNTAYNPLDAHVSLFRGSNNTTACEHIPLRTMLTRTQDATYRGYVEQLRKVYARGDTDGYRTLKERSVAFTPCCDLRSRARQAPWEEKLLSTTGLVHFDCDHLDDPGPLKAALQQDPHLVFAFVSPSGHGVKIGLATTGITGPDDYTHAWQVAYAYLQDTYPAVSVSTDRNVKYLGALCYASYDPQTYMREHATALAIPAQAAPAPRQGDTAHTAAAASLFAEDRPDAASVSRALFSLPNTDATYDTWLTLGMALHSTGAPWARALWDSWSQQSPKYDEAKQAKSWKSFRRDGKVTLGTLFYLAQQQAQAAWRSTLSSTKGGEPKETFANLLLALQHTEPWASACWYDLVRELPMCGTESLSDAMVGRAAFDLEQQVRIPVHTLRLVQAALVQHCRATPRDVLQEWLGSLPPWDRVPRLEQWLSDHAGAPETPYGRDISRLLPVSMVARATHPGCQYRYVVIFEAPEDLGKSKLVKALAGPEWYRELSHGLEGKEGHMILQGAWVAELAELSSLNKTEDARLKSFITMESDDYIPKFANAPVSRRRRTVFIGTINPDGDGAYLRGQTGNTRFLPIRLTEINVEWFLDIREQIFAEALVYYHAHPEDWWRLSTDGQVAAQEARDARRHGSIYENALARWLQGQDETTWEAIAEGFLGIETKDKWKDKALQMEVTKALHALHWERRQHWIKDLSGRRVRKVWTWYPRHPPRNPAQRSNAHGGVCV